MRMPAFRRIVAVASVFAGFAGVTQPAVAQAGADFFRGKTVRLIVGSEAGGGYSAYTIFLAAHFGKHIPGNPSVVAEHMPGTGGVKAINYLAQVAPKDGTVLGVTLPNFWVTPAVTPAAAQFDPTKFKFIGRVGDLGRVLVVWHTAGVTKLEQLKTKVVLVGATSRRSVTSVQLDLLNEVLGTRIKNVAGYSGTSAMLIAVEKGEVQGTTLGWNTLNVTRGYWLRDKKAVVLAGLDFAKVPGVPRVRDLITDEKKRALWDFVALPSEFGSAIAAAPGVPEDHVSILRKAFDATIKDPEFLADAKKRKLDINPQSGAELDALNAKLGKPTPEIAARVRALMGVK